MNSIRRTLGAVGLALAFLIGLAGPAAAEPPNLNGDRITWYGRLPCADGGGVDINSVTAYLTPGYGSYRLRVGLYRSSDDGRLALGPLRDVTATGNTWIGYYNWNASFGDTGNAYVVAYAYRWNGSAYALVAREFVECI